MRCEKCWRQRTVFRSDRLQMILCADCLTRHPSWSCQGCGHPIYKHRESAEQRIIDPYMKEGLTGCTDTRCGCRKAVTA